MILHLLLVTLAGWINREQQRIINSLQEENRIPKAQLRGRRLRLTDIGWLDGPLCILLWCS